MRYVRQLLVRLVVGGEHLGGQRLLLQIHRLRRLGRHGQQRDLFEYKMIWYMLAGVHCSRVLRTLKPASLAAVAELSASASSAKASSAPKSAAETCASMGVAPSSVVGAMGVASVSGSSSSSASSKEFSFNMIKKKRRLRNAAYETKAKALVG